jgi:thioredoxin-related protein
MEVIDLANSIKKGTHAAILFTQENCAWCDKMKQSIIDLDLPANEVEVTKELISAFKLEVSPTLLITAGDTFHQVPGYKSPDELRSIIDEIN